RTLLPPSAFFLLTRPPPTSTLFPYTTLFRSVGGRSRSEQPCPGARRGRGPSPWHAGGQHRHRGEPAQVLAPARPAWSRTARVEGTDRGRRRTEICTQRRLPGRSEEHTSELQSRFDLVCRLLLE